MSAAGPPEHARVAILGVGCRLPGARNAEAFWALLERGGDAVSTVPAERWESSEFFHPTPGAPPPTLRSPPSAPLRHACCSHTGVRAPVHATAVVSLCQRGHAPGQACGTVPNKKRQPALRRAERRAVPRAALARAPLVPRVTLHLKINIAVVPLN